MGTHNKSDSNYWTTPTRTLKNKTNKRGGYGGGFYRWHVENKIKNQAEQKMGRNLGEVRGNNNIPFIDDDAVVSIWTLILPRLEVFFLEEWIEHHLELGFDKIYIYDNKTSFEEHITTKHDGSVQYGHPNIKKLKESERGLKWDKKPEANYFEEYSDEEIYKKLHEVVDKFGDRVQLSNWRYGIETKDPYPLSQALGYKHCVENNKSDWWMTIDPDEYIMLYEYDSIKSLISYWSDNGKWFSIKLEQRIFDERVKNKSVRGIYNWAYDLGLTKAIVKNPKFCSPTDENLKKNPRLIKTSIFLDIHQTYSWYGGTSNPLVMENWQKFVDGDSFDIRWVDDDREWIDAPGPDGARKIYHTFGVDSVVVPDMLATIHHYRGDPMKQGGLAHSAAEGSEIKKEHDIFGELWKWNQVLDPDWSEKQNTGTPVTFDNIDESMKKYTLYTLNYNEWEEAHQPYELEFHKRPNFRWKEFKYHYRWDDCWNKLFERFMEFNKKQFKDSDMILDVGCGSRPCLVWFESGDKHYLDSLIDEYMEIDEMKKYWEPVNTSNLYNQPAEMLNDELRGKFSFILCWNVLDHTYDWKKIIDNISLYLKDDGVALIGNDFGVKGGSLGHPGIYPKSDFYEKIEEYFEIVKEFNDFIGREVCLSLRRKKNAKSS